jgi:hypothetical protein
LIIIPGPFVVLLLPWLLLILLLAGLFRAESRQLLDVLDVVLEPVLIFLLLRFAPVFLVLRLMYYF